MTKEHNGDTKPSRYKASAYGRGRHRPPAGAPGTPNGPHNAKPDCRCGGCMTKEKS